MKKTQMLTFAFVLTACGFVAHATDPAAKPAAKPAAPAAQPAGAFKGGTGKVLETMDASGYTYAKVDVGGSPVWVAGPQTKLKKGQTVTVPMGAPMPNFHSKSLNRTFDMVYFVGGIDTGGAAKTK